MKTTKKKNHHTMVKYIYVICPKGGPYGEKLRPRS